MNTNNQDLAQEVLNILETIRIGEVDPLDFQLVDSYKRLQQLISDTEDKLQIDEMLNEVLGSKVLRIQELAKILTSPELYVEKLKTFKTKQLAKLATYRHPIVLHNFNYNSLSKSFQRVTSLIDSLNKPIPEEQIPSLTTLPKDFAFQSEDPLLIENLKRFLKTLPKRRDIQIDQVLNCVDFDEFLRRFLYVILVISKGMVEYNPQTRRFRRV
jgi:hypothetical protein